MEVSNCTFGFGAIIQRDLCTLFLLRDSPRDNLYACMILSPHRKGKSRLIKLLGGLNNEKIWSYNNSTSVSDGKMAATTDSPLQISVNERKCYIGGVWISNVVPQYANPFENPTPSVED